MAHDNPGPPKLADLLARYLERRADAASLGAAGADGDVTPYEAGPVQPIDPKLAWDEAVAVLPRYGAGAKADKAPPHWAGLVAGQEPLVALPFCVGNFPQLVRDFQLILHKADLTALRPQPGRPVPAPELDAWADEIAGRRAFPSLLLALGTLRLAKHFDVAERYVAAHDAAVPAEWRAAWDNERAALAWHAGRADAARALWDRLEPTVPVRFNRGMTELFLNQPDAARAHLSAAVAQISEQSAWHHLGRLYLALASLRG